MKLLPRYYECRECGNYVCTQGFCKKEISVLQQGKNSWEAKTHSIEEVLPCGEKGKEFFKEIDANRSYKTHSYLKSSYEDGYEDGYRDAKGEGFR
jgi:hypothetical protein